MTCIHPALPASALAVSLILAGCGGGKSDPHAEAPPPAKVETAGDPNVFQAEHAEQFPIATAESHMAVHQLRVTGSVVPDVSRSVPVISIATGRVVDIHARLGDTVKKGQLLLRVQSADLSGAFSDYRKAVVDEQLARAQQVRAQDLYDKGAGPLKDVETANDAEAKAKVDLENTTERIRVLGGNVDNPSAIVEIRAPVSGVITDQQATNASGVAGLSAPNPFTISDLSSLWVLCDVFENDLAYVQLGEKAEIRLNAYPDKVFTGTIGNIGAVLDPAMRTAKVRIEVHNNGVMRPGMFVTATFHGKKQELHTAVPATSILHLHDRDWVYLPLGGSKFRRVEVVSGEPLPAGKQELLSGIQPGQQVVANALSLQNTVEQ